MKIIALNLNGIRSAYNKGLSAWLNTQQADFVCMQELKAQAEDFTAEMRAPEGYYGYFHYAQKKGYSGVGIYSKQPATRIVEGLGIAEIDDEGRYLEITCGDLTVISLYLPSGSSGEERQQFKFKVMAQFLLKLCELQQRSQKIVICGDWNIAHQAIDLKNWKGNLKNSGFLPEERAWMTQIFNEVGWVDVYRQLYPEATDDCYTWWSNRGQAWAKNVGWRIDYQIATPLLACLAHRAEIYKTERFSDHAPLIIEYKTSLYK